MVILSLSETPEQRAWWTVSEAFAELEGLAETIETVDGRGTEAAERLSNYPDLDEAFRIITELVDRAAYDRDLRKVTR